MGDIPRVKARGDEAPVFPHQRVRNTGVTFLYLPFRISLCTAGAAGHAGPRSPLAPDPHLTTVPGQPRAPLLGSPL